ncbi:guanylate-binding protein [Trifolium repens]|nr:guanylate-binding protein [Trifolium repens]
MDHLLFLLILCLFSTPSFSIHNFHQSFPIVEPDPGHTKLRLSREGLEAIQRITNPIASVAVIGPHRSGKSFLLNQLLSLSCYEGFGVGHMRDVKTKGIWVWGTPIEVDINGVRTSVIYLDTEGFESVGKSNVYDDRIFSLATVMSSVLIYNLPETIREADISRLSFAGNDVAFEPAKLLWLIQRDFLRKFINTLLTCVIVFIHQDINEVILSGGRRCQHRLALVWHSVIWGLWKLQNDVIFSLEVDFG